MDVGVAQAGGLYPNEDLIGAWLGYRNLEDFERLVKLVTTDAFMGAPPSRV